MPKNPFRIVLQVPGFAETLARKPRLVASVLRQRALRVSRRRVGLDTLAGLEYAVTYACQADCAHCSATSLFDADRERKRLDLDQIRAVASSALALGVFEVNLTGGEPTLMKNLEEIVACFRPERTFIGINTNGMLLDAERVRSLRDAGVDLLKISLDSPESEAHDDNRGLPGCFDHVLEMLEVARSLRGIRGHICTVGTSELIRSGGAARLLQLAEQHDATIGFTLPAAVGRWEGHQHLMLPEEDLEALRSVCRHPRAFFQGSVGTAQFRCPAGREEVYISPYGEVLSCPFIQRSFGNVLERPLEQIYGTMGCATALAGDASLCLAGQSCERMGEDASPVDVSGLSPGRA